MDTVPFAIIIIILLLMEHAFHKDIFYNQIKKLNVMLIVKVVLILVLHLVLNAKKEEEIIIKWLLKVIVNVKKQVLIWEMVPVILNYIKI